MDPGIADSTDLFLQFPIRTNLPFRQRREELRDGRGQSPSGDQRFAANEDEMAPDVERWILPRQANSIVERVAVRHQSRCGEDSVAMSVDDSLVHVAREPEIIGVDDQLFAGIQNMVSLMLRNFFGFARMSRAKA